MPNVGRHEAAGSHGTIQLRDGRALGYVEYGDPTGPGLLYFHGHPGSRLEAKFLAPAATQAGVRLIGIDRPGMGLSTYQPRRRLLDWIEDVEQLADHRAIDRFSVVGFSGGGPYAAACAYRIPHRLNACGLVASVGHVGMAVTFLARWLPWIFTYAIRRSFADAEHARRSLRWFARGWVEPDRQALSQPGITELIAATLAEAFRQGARGAAYEGTLLGRPWGFPLRDITHPAMHLWHGERDREVPIKVARAVAAERPSVAGGNASAREGCRRYRQCSSRCAQRSDSRTGAVRRHQPTNRVSVRQGVRSRLQLITPAGRALRCTDAVAPLRDAHRLAQLGQQSTSAPSSSARRARDPRRVRSCSRTAHMDPPTSSSLAEEKHLCSLLLSTAGARCPTLAAVRC